MRKAPSHNGVTSTTPLKMAEHICDRLVMVPWSVSAWLEFRPDGGDRIVMHKSQSAEEALYRARGHGVEVGTYRKGARAADIQRDILESYREQP